ncbi:MAG: LamG-like jellyroll fold domain-containing protein [Eubacteriales bacterium]|nr:LamG-like jellyroll fold domain-containing protein [Eubacteriales bacterium]
MRRKELWQKTLSWLLIVSMTTPGMTGITPVYAEEWIRSEEGEEALAEVPDSIEETGIQSAEDIVYFVDCGIMDSKNESYVSDSPYYDIADMVGVETAEEEVLASPSNMKEPAKEELLASPSNAGSTEEQEEEGSLASPSNLSARDDEEETDLASPSNAGRTEESDEEDETEYAWEVMLIDDLKAEERASQSKLQNLVPDQKYVEGETAWGYTKAGNVKTYVKDAGALNGTGYWGSADVYTEYIVTLNAGDYTLLSGHREWWGQTEDRITDVSLAVGSSAMEKVDSAVVNKDKLTDVAKATFHVENDNTKVRVKFSGTGNVVSWFAVVDGEEQGESGLPMDVPTLEDNGEVSVRNGAEMTSDLEDGSMITVTTHWISGGNSAADGGGAINDAAGYLKKPQFSLYTDMLLGGSKDNEGAESKSAFLIGNPENHIRLISRKADGTAALRVHTGGKDQDYPLKSVLQAGTWHGVGVVYQEDGTQGSVTISVDGEILLDATGIGFKFSEQDEMTAGYGIAFGTGYMREGFYDRIVVLDEASGIQEANTETAARKALKESLTGSIEGTRIVIDGAEVDEAAQNMNGLTFKGFGLLDCNSTNALLLDYKAMHPDQYWELLEYLFGGDRPLIQHIKIEMGNDKNNSTGSQACTMRTSDEYPDVTRVTGFQLAADAKKINPNVKTSLLYWRTPGWVGGNWDNLYKWMKNTSIAAYREYGYMIDMISPGMNENKDDLNWLKEFKTRVQNDEEGLISSDASVAGFPDETSKELFHNIKVIMSDEVGIASDGPTLTSDEALRSMIDVIGYHYNTDDDSAGSFTRLAEEFDKEIWNSEAQATFGSTADRPNNNMSDNAEPGTGIGGAGSPLEMANTIIKGFVNSRRTHFVYQPAIGAFYAGTQYNYKNIMSAADPWSGYLNYDGALTILQHFAKFAVTGWEYDSPDDNVVWRAIPSASKSTATGTNPVSGRNGGDNYMTLAAPDKSAFSTILNNDSGREKTFTIRTRGMNLGDNPQLEVWETRAAEDGQLYNANYLKCVETLTSSNGNYVVTVKPWSIVTVTSLDMQADQDDLALPAATDEGRYVLDTDETGKEQDLTDGYLYADDFDYEGMEADGESFMESRGGADGFYPLYTQDVNGTFEVVMKENGNGVLRMNGQTGGSCWNGGEPATILGDYRWTNYKVSVDFNLNSTSEYLLLGARQRGAAGGGDNKVSMSAYNLAVNQSGSWILRRHSDEIARGTVSVADPSACNVALRVAGDTVTAYIEGAEVASYKDPNPQLEGRIMLGVGLPGAAWRAGEFDNLKVETVPGYMPYLTMVHDNLHMRAWDGENAGAEALVYDGNWSHRNQVGSNVSERSLSSTSEVGAGISYTFEGTGLALIGANPGTAKVNVEVDGETLYTDAPTIATNSHQPYFVVRGLENGTHTVRISLAGGKLEVDSVGYMTAKENVSSNVDFSDLETVMETMSQLKEAEYDADSWREYQEALNTPEQNRWTLELVERLKNDPVSYGADQEVVDEIADRYQVIMDLLTRKDAAVEITDPNQLPKMLAVPVRGGMADLMGGVLPDTVSVKNMDGTTNEAAEIKWELSGDTGTEYGTAEVIGTVTGGKNLTVTIPVEVIPDNLVYFVDAGTEDQTVYNLYKSVCPDLKNDKNDQISENGSWGRSEASVKGSTNPMNKLDTGIYGDTIVYTLPLEAGMYTITSGFTEWWGYGRAMSQTVSYQLADGTTKTVNGDAVNFGSREKAVSATTFILPEDAVVTYTLAKTGSEQCVLSWLTVTESGSTEEAVWEPVFHSDERNQWDGLMTYGTVVTKTDEEQGEVLHMNAAGTTYAQLDPEAFDLTGREHMTMSFDLKSETKDGNFFTVAIGQDSNKYFFLRTREHDVYTAITKGSWGSENKASAQVDTYNKWVHMDLVFTPEQMITYMDGVPVSTIQKNVFMTDLGTNPIVYLGKSFYGGDKYFAGAFDNIEFYNRARSAEELALSHAVVQAEKKQSAEYTEESWAVFAAALTEAKAVLADSQADADARTAAKEILAAAEAALVVKTPQMALEDQVEAAEQLKQSDYTKGSWNVFEAALNEAKSVLADETASDEARIAAKDQLQAAMSALVKAADKKNLETAVREAEKLVEAEYTVESWKVLQDALEQAKAVLAKDSAVQEEVAAAAVALQEARSGLVKAEGLQTAKLEQLMNLEKTLKKSDYTDESWNAWKAALSSAKQLLKQDDATQEMIDEAAEHLEQAYKALEKKQANAKPDRFAEDTDSDDSDDSSTVIITDAKKGQVSTETGIITGDSAGYSKWVPVAQSNQDVKWKLVYADGTTAAGKIVKDEAGHTEEHVTWEVVNGAWYTFGADGYAKSGLVYDPALGGTFYVDINSGMKTGWQMIDGKWYYFNPVSDGKKGIMLTDTWVDGKYLDKSGVMAP